MKKKSKASSSVLEASKMNEQVVIGIGASAGGLEALQDFFSAMPVNTSLAFVVIQHLSPDYKSLMDELLARHTSIPIQVASDGMPIKSNNIYLIPPRKNISIFHEKLYLEDQGAKKGLNLPIDIFFRSLAAEKGKHAIGIILSGTGSDGTLGTRAIKEAGGMIMVQDEMTAKFDGMPRSSIATGLVDYILHPSKMPEALLNYVEHPFIRKSQSKENILGKDLDTLTKITLILRDYCGIDFSYYKENTIIRRLERRVSINRFNTLEEYLVFLSESDKEKDILYREMLIGVTRFFRDVEAFTSLTKNILSQIQYNPKVGVRVWSVGCSTGEEVYSLAMLFLEFMSKNQIDCDIKIFATDIDRQSLDVAGQGFYPDSIVSDIDPALLAKYFTRRENGYQVNENVRKIVVFATHNLLKDPPFSKLDLIVCRNLFIYFKPEMQQRILAMFYYALKPSAYLFMGSSESIGEMSEAFEAVDSKWKIYRGREGYKSPIIRDMPLHRSHSNEAEAQFVLRSPLRPNPKIDKLLDSALASFMPPSFIVDENDNIVHVVNDINPFIELQPGRFSQNLLSILKNELSLFVNNILRKIKKDKKNLVFENITGIKGLEGNSVKIEGRSIAIERNTYYIISFSTDEQITSKRRTKKSTVDVELEVTSRVVELEKELQTSRENLQATVEELETSNEELQSSNEELIASNEELQSTNEELQSVNEELFTVNSEYQTKIEELTRMTNDLDNLLKNTEVGALYLDRKLCIRKITPAVTKISNILPTDIGRPISHIAVMPNYKDLVDDVTTVVESLQSIDKEITGSDGKVWQARVRPYRTDYNAVEGIMITFIDITRLKNYENTLKQSEEKYRQIVETTEAIAWEYDVESDKWTYVAPQVEKIMGYKPSDWTDLKFWEGNVHPDDREWASLYCSECTQRGEDHSFEYRFRKRDGGYLWIRDVVSVEMNNGKPLKLRGLMFDITEKKEVEQKLTLSDDIFNYSIDMLAISGFDGYYKTLNPAWEKTLGWSNDELKAKPWIEFVHPDDHEKTLTVKAELVNGQEIFQFENRYICKDGTVKWLSWRSFPYSKNRVIFAVARDVTQLKNIEEGLRQSEDVFNHSIDMLCIAGFEGYFKTLNPAWEKTLGWSTKELLVKPWLEYVHPDDKEATENAKSTIVDGQEVYQFENRYICKDGSVKWLSWNSFPYPERKIMFGVARDVTLLKQTQRELNLSRELFQKTLDNSPLAKTLLDVEGNIIYANKPAEKIFGITQTEITKRTYDGTKWEITGLDGKPIPSEELPFSVIKRTGKNITDFRHYIKIPGKSKVLLSIYGSPVIAQNGEFEGAAFSIGVVE